MLSSFINGTPDENLLPFWSHSSVLHSDTSVLPSSTPKFRTKSHSSLADPRLSKAPGTPRFGIPDMVNEITVHTRWNNRRNRFIQCMHTAGLWRITARAVSQWRQKMAAASHTAHRDNPTGWTCTGRKFYSQPAKSDTAQGSHMNSCEVICKWHEHGAASASIKHRDQKTHANCIGVQRRIGLQSPRRL